MMAHLTCADIRRIAGALGHADLNVTQTPMGRWYAVCSCGYRSTNKINSRQAASSAVHHFEIIARTWSASGAPFPDEKNPPQSA